jgi:hypothetical protein
MSMTFWNLRRKRKAVAKTETKATTEKVEKKPTTKSKGAK